jgi:ATP-grasp domain
VARNRCHCGPLAAYGIPLVAAVGASSPEEAVATADRLGYPVALKARSGEIVHKTDVGAVRLGLDSPDSVRRAFTAMHLALGEAMGGAVEAAAFIAQLQETESSGELAAPRPPNPRVSAAEQVLRRMPAEQLAAELQRRGWVVVQP